MSQRPVFNTDQFDFLQELGAGSFGYVYLIQDRKTKQKYALKVTKNYAQDADLFEIEASILNQLKEIRGIPRIYGFYDFIDPQTNEVNIAILMEYIDGPSLGKIIPQLDERQVVDIAIELINIINKMHQAGYIHRDIKPENILIDAVHRRVYLVDLGISCQDFSPSQVDFCRGKAGTYIFMSPDALMGANHPDNDYFSLGATLRYILDGDEYYRQGVDLKAKAHGYDPAANFRENIYLTWATNDLLDYGRRESLRIYPRRTINSIRSTLNQAKIFRLPK